MGFAGTAASIVSRAIGEDLFTCADPNAGKDPNGVSKGRAGGLKGGIAGATKLSADQQKSIAKKAARGPWKSR